jgi:hypothetical protein
MKNMPTTFIKPVRNAVLLLIVACITGFLAHYSFGWMPSLIEHWLTMRKDQFMSASHFQQFGLLTLGLSGVVVTTTAFGREPVFSGRLLWQSGAQVLYIGSGFVGVILGLVLAVSVKEDLATAVPGFLLAIAAVLFVAFTLGLSFALLQFPVMRYKSARVAQYRKQITIALGISIMLIAARGLWADMSANNAVNREGPTATLSGRQLP